MNCKINSEKETIEQEIKKVQELIKKVKKERRRKIDTSYFHEAIIENYCKCKFNKEFIETLKNEVVLGNLDKNTYKKIKKFKIKHIYSITVDELLKSTKKEWNEFLKILDVVNNYWNEFILSKEKKKLCHYTDCYKEMAIEKFCKKCASSNPIEAIYCNHCGEKL